MRMTSPCWIPELVQYIPVKATNQLTHTNKSHDAPEYQEAVCYTLRQRWLLASILGCESMQMQSVRFKNNIRKQYSSRCNMFSVNARVSIKTRWVAAKASKQKEQKQTLERTRKSKVEISRLVRAWIVHPGLLPPSAFHDEARPPIRHPWVWS